jgi:hypothetical protein
VLINQLPAQAFQVAIQLLTDLVNNSVSIEENTTEIIEIYPNPTTEKVQIDMENADPIPFEVRSKTGAKLFEGILSKEANEISFSNLAQGTYFITLKSSPKNKVFKVIRN